MDYEQNPYDDQPAVPPPPAPPRRLSKAALGGGVAVFLALGGAGAAFALTGSGGSSSSSAAATTTTTPSSSSTTVPSRQPFGRGGGHGFGGRAFGGGAFGGFGGFFGGQTVHSQYTIKTGSGYQTMFGQVGTVVNVSSSSIEVKSSDGYDQMYVVQPSTIVDSQAGGIAAIAKSDQVTLQATQTSGQDVATNIVDTTKIGSSRRGFGFGPGRPDRPGQSGQSDQPGQSGQRGGPGTGSGAAVPT